jgi:hypothetical protein
MLRCTTQPVLSLILVYAPWTSAYAYPGPISCLTSRNQQRTITLSLLLAGSEAGWLS